MLREAAAQNFGTSRSAPGGEAAKDGVNGSGGDASGGASAGREGTDSQQQQEAEAAGGGARDARTAGGGGGEAGQQAKANFAQRGRGVLSMVWSEVSQAISPTAGSHTPLVCERQRRAIAHTSSPLLTMHRYPSSGLLVFCMPIAISHLLLGCGALQLVSATRKFMLLVAALLLSELI